MKLGIGKTEKGWYSSRQYNADMLSKLCRCFVYFAEKTHHLEKEVMGERQFMNDRWSTVR